ncbi:hypothetical protein QBC40DRAFT_312353 [Triangularia verruculosa]|uniref:Uncharacterized protein n=1 Tax=Triangularia verruculosa TaxID=2587418 RepID=A0AAN6XPM0_9PEZI|nr:hypothetical protein QBC40DRAFT_312353 [Triangularia verruculosa]
MPTYLTHSFPLPRPLIRIFTLLHDLPPCSPEHLIPPASSHAFLTHLRTLYPFLPPFTPPPSPPSPSSPSFNLLASQSYSPIKILEPYNPTDLTSAFTPHAYIADYAVQIDTAADISSLISQYEADNNKGDWFQQLATELMNIGGGLAKFPEETGGIKAGRIGWYVVVNGDEERSFPGLESEHDPDDEEKEDEFKLEAELLGKGKHVEQEEKKP